MTAKQLLQSNATVKDHFETWARSLRYPQPIDRIIDKVRPRTWFAFSKSEQGQACYNAGIKLSDYVCEDPDTAPSPSKPATPATPEPELPQPTPVPKALPTPRPAPMPTSSNPLIAALIQELQNAGYTPQQAVTAEQCQSIAEETVLRLTETVLEQVKALGVGGQHTVVVRSPEKTVTVKGHVPAWFDRLRKLAECRVSALLVGPAGSGKTTAVKMLAESMELPFHRVSIAAGTDEGQLQGWLHPVGDHMRFDYVSSVVSHAYEHGGVVLIDDIDLGDPNALGILNAALDNGSWHIPLRHDKPQFERHADFYVCAAANTWGHGADRRYVGANQLDERTLSRLRLGQIRCDYDEGLEQDLYDARTVVVGQRIRARCRALAGCTRDVSTRDIEATHKLLGQFSVDEAWYGFFADWSDDECTRVHVSVDHAAMTACVL